MAQPSERETLYAGQHLTMVRTGTWEFASRNIKKPCVGIVAITDTGNVVLVEQHRPPIGRTSIEIPAGLSGDIEGAEDESLVEAAKRELLEETGYSAQKWTEIGSGYSSPGLTDESVVLFLARGLEKVSAGGGDDSEDIVVHEVGIDEVSRWLDQKGHAADLKLLAGIFLAKQEMSSPRRS